MDGIYAVLHPVCVTIVSRGGPMTLHYVLAVWRVVLWVVGAHCLHENSRQTLHTRCCRLLPLETRLPGFCCLLDSETLCGSPIQTIPDKCLLGLCDGIAVVTMLCIKSQICMQVLEASFNMLVSENKVQPQGYLVPDSKAPSFDKQCKALAQSRKARKQLFV